MTRTTAFSFIPWQRGQCCLNLVEDHFDEFGRLRDTMCVTRSDLDGNMTKLTVDAQQAVIEADAVLSYITRKK